MKNLSKTTIDNEVVNNNEIHFPLEREATIALFALVEALSFEVLSGDVWWLAHDTAKHLAVKKYGLTEEVYMEVMKKIEAARQEVRKGNPLSSMF